jgi:hypothetical protein
VASITTVRRSPRLASQSLPRSHTNIVRYRSVLLRQLDSTMPVATEVGQFNLLSSVDLTQPDSPAIKHLQKVFQIVKQAKGYVRAYWVSLSPSLITHV